MRYAITVGLLIIGLFGFGQVDTAIRPGVYQAMPQNGYGPVKRMQIDSVLTIPEGITATRNLTGGRNRAQLRYNTADSSLYIWTGSQFLKVQGSGGGSVDTSSLSNRINQKLNIIDTAGVWVGSVEFKTDSAIVYKGSTRTAYYLPSGITTATLSDSLKKAIPIGGTNSWTGPVTGTIEQLIDGDDLTRYYNGTNDQIGRVYVGGFDVVFESGPTGAGTQYRSGGVDVNQDFFTLNTFGPSPAGIIGGDDYSPNYNAFTYIQRIYLDRVADSLRNEMAAGGNTKYLVSGSGVTVDSSGAVYTPKIADSTRDNIYSQLADKYSSSVNRSAWFILGNHTSGSAPATFGKLNVNSIDAAGTPGSGNFLRGDGSWTAGALSPWLYTGSDIYYTAGKVGVATSSPANRLTVNSSGLASTQSTTGGLLLENTTVGVLGAITQLSPAVQFLGNYYSGGINVENRFQSYMVPGADQFGAQMLFRYSNNSGSSWVTPFSFTGSGNGTFNGTVSANTLSAGGINSAISGFNNTFNNQATSAATFNQDVYKHTGTFTNLHVSAIQNGRSFSATPTITNTAGGTSTITGFYFGPTVGTLGNTSIVGFNNTIGTNFFNTTSGGSSVGQTTSLPSSRLFQVSGTSTQASAPFPSMTAAQKTAIVSPTVGDHIYQTDGTEGVYVYKSSGWTFAY